MARALAAVVVRAVVATQATELMMEGAAMGSTIFHALLLALAMRRTCHRTCLATKQAIL